jgi:alginate O-acetyltransferase complex protein AlgI
MLFNSVLFLIFFLVVYIIYHLVNQNQKKIVLLFASMIFYASWDFLNFSYPIPRFFIHFLTVISINYLFILGIEKAKSHRNKKTVLIASVLFNILNLGFFKYFYFSIEIIGVLLGHPEWRVAVQNEIHIILPIAISFYTFQTISFLVDKYRGEIPEHTNYIDFTLFIFFFPQQLAGPILKANEFFPRLYHPKKVDRDDILTGLYHIILGIIKKGVFADSLAYIINPIFSNPSEYSSTALFFAIISFLFQLWGDFSGYSDMAIGCGKLLGFDLPNNFNRPFFSIRFSEMWLRWHFTLSRFLRDYIYFPLGGSKYGELRTSINSGTTMVIAGIWHGANWNYILWGVIISFSLILEKQLLDRFYWWKEKNQGVHRFFKGLIIFLFWLILSLIFRINQLSDISIFTSRILNLSEGKNVILDQFILIPIVMMIIQYYEYSPKVINLYKENFWKITIVLVLILLFILTEFTKKQVQFIYFQF